MPGLFRHAPHAQPRRQAPPERPPGASRDAAHELDEKAARELAWDLRSTVRGEVRFDAGSRALYATDGSNYRHVPIGVVVPADVDDAVAAIAVCRAHRAPILSRGGGTSLAGQCCNVAVVIDWSKRCNRILEIDPVRKLARVEPGVVLDDLRREANQHGLTFAPDPSTHSHCTLGGMIGNDSCGVHSVMAGKTVENTVALDVLTYDGERFTVGRTDDDEYARILAGGGRRAEIYRRLRDLIGRVAPLVRARYPRIPRRVSGYNLDDLLPENGFDVAKALVGSEGTCVTVLGATLRLVDWPAHRSLVVLGYPDVYSAGDHVTEILKHGPIGLEGLDDRLIGYNKKKGANTDKLKLLPKGGGWLLVEFGGATRAESDAKGRAMMAALEGQPNAPTASLFDDPEQEEMLWKIRESGLGATANVPGEPLTWEGWEDSAVPPERLGGYLRDLRALFGKYGYGCSLYGHFGQGCVHTRIDFDLFTADGIAKYRSFATEAAHLVVRYGGSLSGEHGDGQSRGELLPIMFGDELVGAFREFKSIWDPQWKMNPGKVVDAQKLDEGLRLGAQYNPWSPTTHFAYQDDDHDFAEAALRCVGVGNCRREDKGTMCPSYMVTREEKHSTRGRARLLFEMLRGEVLKGGWRDKAVKEALDLCLACKGCKGDCPVNVDMATYKAEFLAHYYAKRLRPRSAYAFGWIWWWARIASRVPRIVNWLTHAPLLARAAKWFAGMPREREIPRFAPRTFQRWFRERAAPPEDPAKPAVILWPDTFNDRFHPHTAMAATLVLESAGRRVLLPPRPVCCGRPLYDYGFLGMARARLLDLLDALRPWIRDGVPLVGVEPSCLAVFRDELTNLLPNDHDAHRLAKNAFSLAEYLGKIGFEPPKLAREAIFHAHCHQGAVVGSEHDLALLKRMGVDARKLDSGCCGMAGSFGFEQDHYGVSVACGERRLLPEARGAADDALLIADGFSCRTQVEQLAGRRPLHLAEVILLAQRFGERGPATKRPEDAVPEHDWLA